MLWLPDPGTFWECPKTQHTSIEIETTGEEEATAKAESKAGRQRSWKPLQYYYEEISLATSRKHCASHKVKHKKKLVNLKTKQNILASTCLQCHGSVLEYYWLL